MKILITAFGPFGQFDNNPSERLLKELQLRSLEEKLGIQVEWEVLPVSFNAIDDYLGQLNPEFDLIIHMGVATNESMLRFEVVGRNTKHGTDNAGQTYAGVEIVAGENDLATSFPAPVLQETIGQHPDSARISEDAGDYLCNYVYFKSLYDFRMSRPVLFVHVADVDNQPNAPSLSQQADIVQSLITNFIASV